MGYCEQNSFYWPPIQWGDLYEFKTDLLLVIEPFDLCFSEKIVAEISV
jgi:hypothetical protein